MSRPPPTSTRTVPLFPTTPLFRPPIWGTVMPVAETNKLAASDEILMRQVHPKMMQQEGRLWSGAFTPTKADNGLLSADRDYVISPKEAYERRSEEHTSELQSLMRTSYAAFCMKKKHIIIKKQ